MCGKRRVAWQMRIAGTGECEAAACVGPAVIVYPVGGELLHLCLFHARKEREKKTKPKKGKKPNGKQSTGGEVRSETPF